MNLVFIPAAEARTLIYDYLLVAFVGLIAGLSLGMIGVGWGALSVPLLILFGFEPSVVVGTVLMTNVAASLLGSWAHWKGDRSDLRVALLLSLGGFISSIMGALFSLSIQPDALALVLSVYLTLGGLVMLVVANGRARTPIADPSRGNRLKFLTAGAVPGFFEGAYGSGGPAGVITLLLLKVQAHRAVGSWLPATVLVQLAPALLYMSAFKIDWLASISLLIMGLPAVVLGSHFSGRISEKILTRVISLAVLLLGVRVLLSVIAG